jgi:hypothetical protein
MIKKHLSLWMASISHRMRVFGFNIKERLTGYPQLKKDFKEKTGYELDLRDPKSFNQKVNWKKIHDRNPVLPIVADKYRVREYLRYTLGIEEAEKILVPLLYVTDNPETIPFDDLPEEYIIKANHGSGTNIIVERGKPIDRQQIIAQCNEWLNKPYALYKHEWAYQSIKRKIIIEKLLRDEDGHIPKDYKFHIMNGKCQLIVVFSGRFIDVNISYYDRAWNFLDIGFGSPPKRGSFVQRPDNLDDMIKLAEFLGSPFDYIRVDLYSINGRIYFGELTNYPLSGLLVFDPRSFDFELGSKWQITPKYWKKNTK